ncbi:MAG: 3'(2'),5'-bisphosphate nucleotidase CysQ [Candidatus Elarobacter sp.]
MSRMSDGPVMSGAERLDTRDLSALLDGVRSAVVRAGDAIAAIARTGACEAWSKADESPLTAADLTANAIILDALRALDPLTPVISEETVCELDELPRSFWLVDPLDGTREFVAGNGEYTVNVALVEDGVPVLGVVHAPARAVTYCAARGAGATRTDVTGTHPIRAHSGGELVVVASRSHPSVSLAVFLAALPRHSAVTLGSSLKLCLVADGAAQIYPRLGPTCWWDTAAGHAVVLESGAHMSALDGTPLRYDDAALLGTGLHNPSFVCSSLPREAWAAAARAAG